MALMHSKGMPVGTPAPPFSLPGVDGKDWSLDSFADAELLVVVFTCNHCPYAIASEDRLLEIQSGLRQQGRAARRHQLQRRRELPRRLLRRR